jgi:hypothetical protein
MHKTLNGNKAPSLTHVFRCLKRHREGHEDLEDDPRSRWSSTVQNKETVATEVPQMVARDHQRSLKLIEDQLCSNHKMSSILHEYLEERRVCAKCVPHSFMDELILPR